jgi:hypothetical protein
MAVTAHRRADAFNHSRPELLFQFFNFSGGRFLAA